MIMIYFLIFADCEVVLIINIERSLISDFEILSRDFPVDLLPLFSLLSKDLYYKLLSTLIERALQI